MPDEFHCFELWIRVPADKVDVAWDIVDDTVLPAFEGIGGLYEGGFSGPWSEWEKRQNEEYDRWHKNKTNKEDV